MLIILGLICLTDINSALADYHAHHYQRALTKFEQCLNRQPNDPRIPEVLYYLALLQTDPEVAQGYYKRVVDFYPTTEWAERACLNYPKIDYALTNYLDALSGLNRFIREYPRSGYRAEALYWLGLSSIALHDRLSGEKYLTELTKTFPQSQWALRVEIKPTEEAAAVQTAPPPQSKPFTIQVGSFQSKTNAQSLIVKLKKIGFDADLKEVLVQGTTYFRIWVGSFRDAEDAASTVQSLKANGITGQLVKR